MSTQDVVALLPAAGWARRLGRLPCSKEIYPLLSAHVPGWDGERRGAIEHLLASLQLAGVQRGYVMIRDGKWDIPAYLGDGSGWGVHLAYLMVHLPYGTPYSLDQAYPFVRHARVLLGFPDILFQPADAFIRLLERQSSTGADVVLGLFPASQPQKMDLVEVDSAGRVRSILVKPRRSKLRHAWIIAAWGPAFTEFLHAAVSQHSDLPEEQRTATDLYVGDVLQAAIQRGFNVDSMLFPDGSCIDIGTPEDLARVAPLETRQPLAEPVAAT